MNCRIGCVSQIVPWRSTVYVQFLVGMAYRKMDISDYQIYWLRYWISVSDQILSILTSHSTSLPYLPHLVSVFQKSVSGQSGWSLVCFIIINMTPYWTHFLWHMSKIICMRWKLRTSLYYLKIFTLEVVSNTRPSTTPVLYPLSCNILRFFWCQVFCDLIAPLSLKIPSFPPGLPLGAPGGP